VCPSCLSADGLVIVDAPHRPVVLASARRTIGVLSAFVPGELGYDTGPFVVLAVFCEQAIEDKEGIVTLIRIIDQVTLQAIGPGAPDELPEGSFVTTTFVVGLKAGLARGENNVQITFEHPDGSKHAGPDVPVHFSGGVQQGHNIILKLNLGLSDAGVYWAEVTVNKRLVTKSPLEVRYEAHTT
jgi:hypothetical protein